MYKYQLFLTFFSLLAFLIYIVIVTQTKKNDIKKEFKCDSNKIEEWGAFCISQNKPVIGWNNILDKRLADEIRKLFYNQSD